VLYWLKALYHFCKQQSPFWTLFYRWRNNGNEAGWRGVGRDKGWAAFRISYCASGTSYCNGNVTGEILLSIRALRMCGLCALYLKCKCIGKLLTTSSAPLSPPPALSC
jgi:hypothetical protein